jgi:hypothetical protein
VTETAHIYRVYEYNSANLVFRVYWGRAETPDQGRVLAERILEHEGKTVKWDGPREGCPISHAMLDVSRRTSAHVIRDDDGVLVHVMVPLVWDREPLKRNS